LSKPAPGAAEGDRRSGERTMHELSMTRNLVARALAIAAERTIEKIAVLELEVGELSEVDPAEIDKCFEFLRGEFPQITGTRLAITRRKAQAVCRACGARLGIMDGGRCPRCLSFDIEIICGDQVQIRSVSG